MNITDFNKPTPFLVNPLKGPLPGRALDIGTGYGRNALWLAANGWTVDAVDSDPAATSSLLDETAKQSLTISVFSKRLAEFETKSAYKAVI